MTAGTEPHNAFAGQGSVLLDIGGDIGALVVTMPPALEGVEVEIRPEGAPGHSGHHHAHVAVVPRPVQDGVVPSLVFPELERGRWELYEKGTDDVRLVAEIHGGQVSAEVWPE